MNPLQNLFTGGITGVIDSISGIIGKFVADPAQKMQAQIEMTKIATDYQVQLLNADKDLAVQQASVITAEVKSESWLARNWRPILMLVFTFIIANNYIFAPMFSIKTLPIPDQMWELLKLGIGGYIVGRSVEKIAPDVVTALKK